MKLLRIYNRTLATRLVALADPDFTGFQYRRTFGEIGDCRFIVKLSGAKVNDTTLKAYNRIRFYEDGVLKFTGVITQKQVKLDIVEVRCREQSYILKKRLVGEAYNLSGSVSDVLAQLFTDVNGVEDTGISIGSVAGTGDVNLTFNQADVWTVIKQICDSTGNQFEITPQGKLNVAAQIGVDRSASVEFRYNEKQVSSSNLLGFDVEDDAENIVTRVHGKSDAYTSTQTDVPLQSEYGMLEKYKDFRVINTQDVLDEFTAAEIADRIFSPRIALKPNILDNFSVGDLVKIKLRNPLININSSFQVLEKTVKYVGSQKLIEVRINDLPNLLVKKLADRDKRLELLEKQT